MLNMAEYNTKTNYQKPASFKTDFEEVILGNPNTQLPLESFDSEARNEPTRVKKKITWHIVNTALTAALVISGGLMAGRINIEVVLTAIFAGLIVGLNQFKDFWGTEEDEYCNERKLFNFV